MKKTVQVETTLEIEVVNPDFFSEEFFTEFNRHFYDIDPTVEAHLENLASLYVYLGAPRFIEGYGELKNLVKIKHENSYAYIQD